MCFCENSSATFAALRDAPAEKWMSITQRHHERRGKANALPNSSGIAGRYAD